MFCKSCGQAIEEGRASCQACGAPVDAASEALDNTTVSEATDGSAAFEPVTEVKPPAAAPPPPPSATSAAVPPPPPPSVRQGAAAPPPPPPGVSGPAAFVPPPPGMGAPTGRPMAAVGYGAGRRTAGGPPVQKGRGGLIAGIIAAAVIVLAGVGVGVYFGFFHDGKGGSAGSGGTVASATTLVGSSTTKPSTTSTSAAGSSGTGSATTGTSAGSTSTSGTGTTSTGGGANTTQTVPSLNTSTSRSTTTTTEDPVQVYLAFADTLVVELEYDDRRIPELATEINNTVPDVPDWVHAELQTMLDRLLDYKDEMLYVDVPAPFEEANSHLDAAATNMVNRISATITGIEAMWRTGKADSGTSYFNTGRVERDRYRSQLEQYYETLPAG